MTQLIRRPDGMRYVDNIESRVAALERQLAGEIEARLAIVEGIHAAMAAITVTPGYVADTAFNPEATSLTEVARILATLLDAATP